MGWGGTEPAGVTPAPASCALALLVYVDQHSRQPASRRRRRRATHGARRRSSGRRRRRRRRTTSRRGRRCRAASRCGTPNPTAAGRSSGCRPTSREVLVTHVLDAEPDHVYECLTPSIWPFVTAIATSAHVRRIDLHAVGGRLGVDPGLRSRWWAGSGRRRASSPRRLGRGSRARGTTPLEQVL